MGLIRTDSSKGQPEPNRLVREVQLILAQWSYIIYLALKRRRRREREEDQ